MRLPLLLLVFFSLSFAATVDYSIVPTSAMIAVFLVGGAYMFSQLLQNSQLEAWSKSEWKELILAGITVSLVLAAVSAVGMEQILATITGYQSSNSFINAVENRFQGFTNNLTTDYIHTIKVANRLGMVSSYSYTRAGGYIFYFSQLSGPFVGTSGLMQSLAILAGNLSNALMVYQAMLIFLKFFFNTSIEIILPIGLAMRFIPFTRRVGGTLIALALAGIFIYPFSMVLVAEIHDNIGVQHSQLTPTDLEKFTMNLPSSLTELCTNDFIRFFTSFNEWGWWLTICLPYCKLHCAASAEPTCFNLCFTPLSGICWNAISFPFFNLVQTTLLVSTSIVQVAEAQHITNALNGGNIGIMFDIVTNKLVIPVGNAASVPIMEAVLVAALTIVGARSISAALGGEIAIVGLERLV